MAGKNKEATEAAEKKAEELGVDIQKAEATGSGGKVTVGDVEQAANEPDRLVYIHLNDPMTSAAQGSDGVWYAYGDTVSEAHYDAVLSNDLATGGAKLFRKGRKA